MNIKKEVFKHPNNKIILNYILENIKFTNHGLLSEGVSSYNSLVDYSECNGLFIPYIDKFIAMSGKGFSVLDFWINIVKPGGYTKTHNHITLIEELKDVTMKTGVFYLKKPKNSGNIVIEDNVYKIKENDIIIFEPWMNHKTEQNKSKENRIIFSVNMAKGVDKVFSEGSYKFIKT